MAKNIDFDLDDPLGDLLSDNSNDSFYNDDKHKSPEKKSSLGISLDKKKSDLFGLDNKQTTVTKEPDTKPPVTSTKKLSSGDWLGLTEEPAELKVPLKIKQPEKISDSHLPIDSTGAAVRTTKLNFPDSLNFLDDLGLSDNESSPNLQKNASKNVVKSDVKFENLLGKSSNVAKRSDTPPAVKPETSLTGYSPSSGAGVSNKEDYLKIRKTSSKSDIDKIISDSKPKHMKVESLKDSKGTVKDSAPIASRRQRNNLDWLGIFSEDDNDDLAVNKQSKNRDSDDILSSWLEPQTTDTAPPKEQNKKKANDDITTKEQQNTPNNPTISLTSAGISSNKNQVLTDIGRLMSQPLLEVTEEAATLQLFPGGGLDQQSAAVCLQQNESQLLVALQLQAQEERIAALHERQEDSRRIQREVVLAHRQQLETVLKGQTEHRETLQKVMLQHQERINKHIQSLLRPPLSPDPKVDINLKATEYDRESVYREEVHFQVQGDKMINASEKEQLEQMIFNLKENHNKEIEIMETSYRHQIQLADESLKQVEERLKNENDKLAQHYLIRIKKIEEERVQIILQADERIDSIINKQRLERELMETKHIEDINILQDQHRVVIQNIKETIALEQSSIRELTDYSQKLNSILKDVSRNNEMCEEFMKKFEVKTNEETIQRENSLKIKEQQVNYILESLQKQRDAFETESLEMKLSLETFQARLKQQTQMIEEEREKLKRKDIELDSEKQSIKKANERALQDLNLEKEAIQNDIRRYEEIKSKHENELTERLAKINENNAIVQNEKKVIEDVQHRSQALKLRLETELEEVYEQKNNLKNEEQKLYHEEMKASARSQELEVLTRTALAKHVNAERKISEAVYAQKKYEDRLKRIQEHAISLNSREQQIARDKVALSRERLTLHNQQKATEIRQCGLCRANPILDEHFRYNDNEMNSLGIDLMGNIQVKNNILDMAISRDDSLEKNLSRRRSVDNIDQKFDYLNKITDNKYKLNDNEFTDAISEWKLGKNNSITDEYQLGDFNSMVGITEKPRLFQEIIDPKLVLLKLDVQHSTRRPED